MTDKSDKTDKTAALEFDPAALKRKYAEERDKRLRPDGNRQYVSAEKQFAHFADDRYAENVAAREPLRDDVDVVVVGGGFSGLLTAGYLRRAGIDTVRVIERGGDFGGTWYWNRYPGVACDVESYVYMPLLEEIGYIPTEKYARGAEIFEHSRAIGRHFDLYKDACFQTEVTEIRWDEASRRWLIETNRGDRMRARFVSLAVGTYTRIKLPGIPGIENFKGHSFHTSRWDYDYTGGNANGDLTRLQDKRVAIIGTGATAVQCIPHLGRWAKQLYVMQRTPSGVGVRNNRPTDPEWARTLEPGWQKRRMENFHAITTGQPQAEDLVNDGWTHAWGGLRRIDPNDGRNPAQQAELNDFQVMEDLRRRVADIIEDPATAEAMKPYYAFMCKRPLFHDEYLPTFNRPNVKLVDTKGKGVEAITENAVIVDGEAYEVDVIIYSTGFEHNAPVDRAGGFELRGRNGITLAEEWAGGVRTLHGVSVHNFPNLFLVGTLSQGGGSSNFPFALDGQAAHVAKVIAYCIDSDVASAEATEAAVTGWVDTIRSKALPLEKYFSECTPGYFNQEGNAKDAFLLHVYGGGVLEYFDVLKEWRERHFDRDMEISRAAT